VGGKTGPVDEQEEFEARAHEVQFSLSWALNQDGHLVADLRVQNISQRAVRVSGKPSLLPLGVDGQPLDTRYMMTLEGRIPRLRAACVRRRRGGTGRLGWLDGTARQRLRHRGLAGRPSGSPRVRVRQPTSPGPATNLWSSWFSSKPARRADPDVTGAEVGACGLEPPRCIPGACEPA
jgi:hypothetical protein